MNKNDKNNENKTFAEVFKEKIKELDLTANKSINQNSVELSPNSNDKGQDYATNTHSPTITTLGYGNISNTTTQRVALHTRQHRTSDTGNARKHTTLLADLLAISSTEQEFKQGNADITKGNRNESTSTAKSAESGTRIANEQEISRRGGAQSRESGAISKRGRSLGAGLEEFAKIYGIEIQADEQELKELENKIKEWKQISLKSRELAERLMNNFLEKSIQELQHSQSVFYADALPKAYAKFATAILTLVNLGYKLDQQNATKIQKILKIELNKDLVR